MNRCYQKLSDWANRPLGMPVFVACSMFAGICFLLIAVFCQIYNTDMYFLIETGREILDNGVPYENVWSADSGLGFVAQQWLYAVVVYLLSLSGPFGFNLLILAEIFVFAILLWKLFQIRQLSVPVYFITLAIFLVFSQVYVFTIRPQLISLILLLWECYGIEQFAVTKRVRYLAILPLSVLLEMNLHAAFWPFHFCIILAYVVPTFFQRGGNNDVVIALGERPVTFAFAVCDMVPVLFLNPYGADGILYIVRSYLAKTFQFVSIAELQPLTFVNGASGLIIVCLVLAVLCRKLGRVSNSGVNMVLGFGFLSVCAVRNHMFLSLPLVLLLRDVFTEMKRSNFQIDWKKDLRNYLVPVLLFTDVLLVMGLWSTSKDMLSSDASILSKDTPVVSYIQDNLDEDRNVFVGFDNGAYFEYCGIRNIYLDARPELYMAELNGEKDVLVEYARYAIYGDTPVYIPDTMPEQFSSPVTRLEMDAWLAYYDFQFICVCPGMEPFLMGYLETCSDYVLVDSISSPSMLVYEARGEAGV